MSRSRGDPQPGTLGTVLGPLIVFLTATATLVGWWWVTLTLPEPTPDPDAHDHDAPEPGEPKRPYRDLGRWPHALIATAASLVAALLVTSTTHPTIWPAWLVLSTFGVILAGIDGFTTWIPKLVSWTSWAALAIASLITALLGGPWLATVAGALLTGALFAGMWLGTRGGLGFGDVRFIPLIGAPTLATGWTVLTATLLIGSLLVVAHAMVGKLIRRRPPMVPWAPGYLAGALIALAIHS